MTFSKGSNVSVRCCFESCIGFLCVGHIVLFALIPGTAYFWSASSAGPARFAREGTPERANRGEENGGVGHEHCGERTLREIIGPLTLAWKRIRSYQYPMRHVLSARVQNQPGVLAQISGMLASRGFNIDSLAVGETEVADMARMTFVVNGDDAELDQVRKQLDKVVTVVRVMDISSENFVERDLMLIKVRANPAQRTEVSLLVEMFRGRVVDINHNTLVIEVSGREGRSRPSSISCAPMALLSWHAPGGSPSFVARQGTRRSYDHAGHNHPPTRAVACPGRPACVRFSPVSASGWYRRSGVGSRKGRLRLMVCFAI